MAEKHSSKRARDSAPSHKSGKKIVGDRELIDTATDKRYVRRDDKGRFEESDDVGRSLSQDVKRHAKTKVVAGQGDRAGSKSHKRPLTEDEIERSLASRGVIKPPPTLTAPSPRPAPVKILGRPLSETIIEERR